MSLYLAGRTLRPIWGLSAPTTHMTVCRLFSQKAVPDTEPVVSEQAGQQGPDKAAAETEQAEQPGPGKAAAVTDQAGQAASGSQVYVQGADWAEVVHDESGRTYWWNQATGQTTDLGEARPRSRFSGQGR
eukprot:CAMPEP_0119106734 /NCGR_PEP_ID=MMETSP1180-20130426/6292_1 /TAXON_ID=3052 ORGANISM="Chlamydomonas cf sp, Strain CCMP681" /NCGR_SAMPLE_ID=MMETSP1180 /ASSEMBLY_ACC=CAM_ASM_000741 /LENGTH=129 /DNA_ID=CAMNT_0007092117 /DNA_START=86 /DNA_END=472 /DNA_ORIENTATION=-